MSLSSVAPTESPGVGTPGWARFVAPGVFLIAAASSWYGARRVEGDSAELAMRALAVLMAAAAAEALASLLVFVWTRGRALVDLGRHPGAVPLWFVLPLLLSYWFWSLGAATPRARWFSLCWISYFLWIGIRRFPRVRFLERGVWYDGSLKLWRSIRSVAWVDGAPDRLKLKWGGFLGGSMEIKVPEEKREIVERILEERVQKKRQPDT